jgi:hypothetical protein
LDFELPACVVLKGHGFSRAACTSEGYFWPLGPEGWIFHAPKHPAAAKADPLFPPGYGTPKAVPFQNKIIPHSEMRLP